MSTPSNRRRSGEPVLGVPTRPPLDLETRGEQGVAQSFYTAGDFSGSVSREFRTAEEVQREYRWRMLGLTVALAGAAVMTASLVLSFGWIFGVFPGIIGISAIVLIMWLNLPTFGRRVRPGE